MKPDRSHEHLSDIHTLWSTVLAAHHGTAESASKAQLSLLERYLPAVHSYLLGALHDPHAAEDLTQEFALRFLRGDFHRADPSRGRFSRFIKKALVRLVADYRQRQMRGPLPLREDIAESEGEESPLSASDLAFRNCRRDVLLARTWKALADQDRRLGQPLTLVLRFHSEHPEMTSSQAAQELARQSGKAVSAEWVRKWLSRAREKFADLFLEEVAQSLEKPTAEDLQAEVIELEMVEECREALQRRLESIWPE